MSSQESKQENKKTPYNNLFRYIQRNTLLPKLIDEMEKEKEQLQQLKTAIANGNY